MVQILGNITLGERVLVTDPCYDRGTWCAGVVENVLSGEYVAKIYKRQTKFGWGERVARLSVKRNGSRVVKRIDSRIDVGVDSGQAGIFDDAIYPQGSTGRYEDENSFYRRVCRLTYDDASKAFGGGIIEERGAVSSSGFGDGSYTCALGLDEDDRVVEISIRYL